MRSDGYEERVEVRKLANGRVVVAGTSACDGSAEGERKAAIEKTLIRWKATLKETFGR